MQVRVFVVELSNRQKWTIAALLVPAVLLGAGTLASAAVSHTWQTGDVLEAADLNAAFKALDERIVGMEKAPTYSVVNSTTAFSTSSLSFVDLPGLSVTVTTDGKPVLLTANLNVNPTTSYIGVATITRDGSNLGNSNWGMQIAVGTNSQNIPANIAFVDKPPPGEHTYKIRVRTGDVGEVTFGEVGVMQQLAAIQLR
ncbi:MAG: hypothetical protein ACOY0T_31320 [Myxococcota bacterium]